MSYQVTTLTLHPLNIWGISIAIFQSREAHEGLTTSHRPQDIAQSGSGRELRHYGTGADSGADRVCLIPPHIIHEDCSCDGTSVTVMLIPRALVICAGQQRAHSKGVQTADRCVSAASRCQQDWRAERYC